MKILNIAGPKILNHTTSIPTGGGLIYLQVENFGLYPSRASVWVNSKKCEDLLLVSQNKKKSTITCRAKPGFGKGIQGFINIDEKRAEFQIDYESNND